MAGFTLSEPLSAALVLLIPTYTTSLGVPTKTFPAVKDGIRINGTFKTFGGTDRDVNGVYSVEKTATVDTWYRPDIKSDCRIAVLQTGEIYEILGDPENIGLRNQYIRLRLIQVKGVA